MTVIQQLEKLQGSCELSVVSERDEAGCTWWRITATRRDDPEQSIVGESRDLADAARTVVGHAAVLGLLRDSVRP